MFRCKYCDKEFDVEKDATRHENVCCKSKNSISKNKVKARVREYNCYYCGKKFNAYGKIKDHTNMYCVARKKIN
jgi:hypothetical protein